MIRSDYRIDKVKSDPQASSGNDLRPYEIKQIEINMIAASFGGLNAKVCNLHRYAVCKESYVNFASNIEGI